MLGAVEKGIPTLPPRGSKVPGQVQNDAKEARLRREKEEEEEQKRKRGRRRKNANTRGNIIKKTKCNNTQT